MECPDKLLRYLNRHRTATPPVFVEKPEQQLPGMLLFQLRRALDLDVDDFASVLGLSYSDYLDTAKEYVKHSETLRVLVAGILKHRYGYP